MQGNVLELENGNLAFYRSRTQSLRSPWSPTPEAETGHKIDHAQERWRRLPHELIIENTLGLNLIQGAYFTNVSVDSQGTPNARYGTTLLHYKVKKDVQYTLTSLSLVCSSLLVQSAPFSLSLHGNSMVVPLVCQ